MGNQPRPLRPLHSSVAREKLVRVHQMRRQNMTEEQREFIESMALSIFTDMTNAGHSFQAALSSIYLSGVQHGATAQETMGADQ